MGEGRKEAINKSRRKKKKTEKHKSNKIVDIGCKHTKTAVMQQFFVALKTTKNCFRARNKKTICTVIIIGINVAAPPPAVAAAAAGGGGGGDDDDVDTDADAESKCTRWLHTYLKHQPTYIQHAKGAFQWLLLFFF